MNELQEELEKVNSLEEVLDKSEDELYQILLNTQEQCQMMEAFIKNQIVIKDEMINKLHEELETYKKESANKFESQLLKQVIKVRKNLKHIIVSERWNNMNVEDLQREYRYIYDDLTDLLILQDVDEFVTEAGEMFDASRHQAKIEVTENLAEDKRIKQSLSEGYMKGNKLFIAERVIAYQYREKGDLEE